MEPNVHNLVLLPRQVNFYNKFEKIFDGENWSYKINKEIDSKKYCARDAVETKELFTQQKFLEKFLKQNGIRGIQVYHGLGSGKTCASISSAISLLNTRKFDMAVVFLPAFLRENFLSEINHCRPGGQTLESYKIFSYNSNSLRKNLYDEFDVSDLKGLLAKMENKVIIVDESHHLVQMIHNQLVAIEKKKIDTITFELAEQSNGLFLYKLLMSLKNVKIILLSGTPLTNFAFESAILGNILVGYIQSRKTLFPENSDVFYSRYIDEANGRLKKEADFERRFNGLMSFFPSIEEKSIFPEISAVNEYMLPMQREQYQIYEYYFNLEKQEEKKRLQSKYKDDIPGTFLVYTRMASNFVFPSEYYEKFKEFIKESQTLQNITLQDITLPEFLNFSVLNKKNPQITADKYADIIQQFYTNFSAVSKFYFGKYVEKDQEKNYVGIENLSCKYEYLKNQLVETFSEIGPKKTLIYSNFKNWAGLQSIEYLFNYMGLKRDKKLNPSTGVTATNRVTATSRVTATNRVTATSQVTATNRGAGANEIENDSNLATVETNSESEQYPPNYFRGGGKKKKKNNLEPEKDFDLQEHEGLKKIFNGKKYLIFEGKNKKEIVDMFNKPENDSGEIYPILIISGSGSEGISLLNTRFVHILEPFWNQNRIEQVIGRATRLCSHNRLQPEYRNVTIYKYYATAPVAVETNEMRGLNEMRNESEMVKKSTDMKIKKIAQDKFKIIKKIYNIFKLVAVDCRFLASKKCTQYRCDMSTYDRQKMAKYWYDYYNKNKQEFDDVTKFLQEFLVSLYQLKSVHDEPVNSLVYLAKDIYKKYYIVKYNYRFYQIVGFLESSETPDTFVLYNFNNEPLYKLERKDLENLVFKPIVSEIEMNEQ